MKFDSTPEKNSTLPVYKNMKEDPAYQGDGVSFVDFKNDVFGYKIAQKKDGKIIAIGGDTGKVPYLEINSVVKLKADRQVLGGLDEEKEARIVEIVEPFEDGKTDHIIRVKQDEKTAWLKPSEVERKYFNVNH